jgi:cobalt import ATP-binding protein cbiO 1
MEFIRCNNLTYYYHGYENGKSVKFKALDKITMTVNTGEFVAILGHNGSGKSTIGKILNCLISPDKLTVFVNGMDCGDETNIFNIRQLFGMVFQNPDNQLVSSIVEDEVAFGCENLGIPSDEIRKRVDYALKKVGMYDYRNSVVSNLSGGQKQRIAIAGILAMKPDGIIFDESTAMLDPEGRNSVINIVKELNNEGITVIFITHYMEEALQADRIYVFNNGRIAITGTPKEIFSNYDLIIKNHLDIPDVIKLGKSLGYENVFTPYDLANRLMSDNVKTVNHEYPIYENKENTILSINNVSYTYSSGVKAVDNVSADIKQGELICIIGATGSGKSTLIQLINGIYKLKSGSILYKNKNINDIKNIKQEIGIIFQYPEDQIFESTVFDEVAFAPKNMGLSEDEIKLRVKYALDFVNIGTDYYSKSPLHLSGGEKRKVAIAGVLAMQPKILMLDEPVAGLDPQGRNELIENIRSLRKSGTTVIMVIHSMDLAACIADRIMVMNNGKLVDFDTPYNIFENNEKIHSIGLDIPEITKVFDILNKNGINISRVYDYGAAENILMRALNK